MAGATAGDAMPLERRSSSVREPTDLTEKDSKPTETKSKTREDLLVDPKDEHYGEDFFEKLQSDENLLGNLVDLDWQLFSKHKAYKKAYRHYTVFATVMTMIILVCTSLVVVFEVFQTNTWVSEDVARGVVAVLAFVATVLTGWLSYSGAEGKAALIKEQMKNLQALEIRVRLLTKHHIPGTITVAHAAIEMDKIKKEQLKVHENVTLIYSFEEWGTYSCCFKKCCRPCYNFNRTEVHEQKKNIQWFKKKYCDGQFRKEVRKYFNEYITEGGCETKDASTETKDEETGDAGTHDSDPKSNKKEACCTTC